MGNEQSNERKKPNYKIYKITSNRNFDKGFATTLGRGSSLPGEGGFQENIGEIVEAREMRARANEWSDFDKQMQRAWQLQPPKK